MKKFLWIAFLSFCFSGVAAESDWNADSVQVYFSRSVTPVVLKHYSRDVLLDFRAKMSTALEEKDMDMLHDLDYAFHRYLYEATNRPHA